MSGLSDGYGDALSIDEYIQSNERLLKIKAAERNQDPEFWDDVLQEGRIVQWEVLEKKPDAARSYISAAMSMRMLEVVNRRSWFGSEAKRGHPIDPIRRTDRDSFDDPDFHTVATAADTLDHILLAYHHGEIADALSKLTPRQQAYVRMRFWEGLSNPEIAAKFNLSVQATETEWRTKVKPILIKELKHLEDVVK